MGLNFLMASVRVTGCAVREELQLKSLPWQDAYFCYDKQQAFFGGVTLQEKERVPLEHPGQSTQEGGVLGM